MVEGDVPSGTEPMHGAEAPVNSPTQGHGSPALLEHTGRQEVPGRVLGGKTRWPGIFNATAGLRAPL